MALGRPALIVAIWACAGLTLASGQTLGPPGATDSPLSMRYSLKSAGLWSQQPNDVVLFPDRTSAQGLLRFRIEPGVRVDERTSFEFAFDQRVRFFTSPSTVFGASVLPATVDAPYRRYQLDWRIASGDNFVWYGEIDRAALHVHFSQADLTVGRQAVGWGRGVMFSAVDLFGPFSPYEADREWRRGIDAVRAELKIGDRASLDNVAALGASWEQSALATRLRRYIGNADVELLGGYRAQDAFIGATSSAAIGGAELHGEFALFRAPGPGTIDETSRQVAIKALAGGSWRVPLGNGMLVYAEYLYSGFGAASPARMLSLLQTAAFQERYLRGDSQILGRHAAALMAVYEWSPSLTLSVESLHSPADGSGLVIPSGTWTFNDSWSLLLNAYLPYGHEPQAAAFTSEFGAAPLAVFAQLRLYR